jgi:hypothetical protein
MNQLRNEITDAVIELVFVTFPSVDEKDFRSFVHEFLRIVDYAVAEVLKDERHARYVKNQNQSRN